MMKWEDRADNEGFRSRPLPPVCRPVYQPAFVPLSLHKDAADHRLAGCPNARWTALAEATPFPLSAVGFAQTFHDICANALATCTTTRSRRSRGARQLAWKDDTSCGEDLVASLTDALQRLKRATDAVTSRRGNQQAGAHQSLAAGGEGLELRKRRDGLGEPLSDEPMARGVRVRTLGHQIEPAELGDWADRIADDTQPAHPLGRRQRRLPDQLGLPVAVESVLDERDTRRDRHSARVHTVAGDLVSAGAVILQRHVEPEGRERALADCRVLTCARGLDAQHDRVRRRLIAPGGGGLGQPMPSGPLLLGGSPPGGELLDEVEEGDAVPLDRRPHTLHGRGLDEVDVDHDEGGAVIGGELVYALDLVGDLRNGYAPALTVGVGLTPTRRAHLDRPRRHEVLDE